MAFTSMVRRNGFTFPAVAIMTLDMFSRTSRRMRIITNSLAKYRRGLAPALPSGRRNSITFTLERRPTTMKRQPFSCLNHSLKSRLWGLSEGTPKILGGSDEESYCDWRIDAGRAGD